MPTLPPPSVRSVLELPGLGLVLRAGSPRTPEGSDRPIRWVAISELEDPGAFLEGGELLLSTGMRLPARDRRASARYVDRLIDAGVAAFGLGVGLTHDTVPRALIEAAERSGLVVLEVPEPTPFIAVTKAVSAMVAAQEYEATTRAFETQRDLTRAALGPDAVSAVADRLARALRAWVVVLDPSGRQLAAAPLDANGRVEALSGELAVLRGKGLLASSALDVGGDRVVLHPLGAGGSVRGFVAAGRATPFDRTDTSLVAVAVSLLSLALERIVPGGTAGERVQAAAWRLLCSGAGAEALPLDDLGWGWLWEQPFRVVRLEVEGDRGRAVLADLDAVLPAVERAVVRLDSHVVVLVPDRAEVMAQLDQAIVDHGLVAGGSAGADLASVGGAYVAAAGAARAAVTPAGVRWHDRLGGDGLVRLVDPDAGRAFADSLLAPLDQARGRGDLLASLRAWLSHNGQWDVAAQDLGVHRHTLRYRIRRVEELLGRDLDDAGLRAELWYALALRG